MQNSEEKKAGFVTKQINIQGQTLEEIEKRLGYHRGRLTKGAYFYVAVELPQSDGFDLAGYSQVAGHRTEDVYKGINDPSDPTTDLKKKIASAHWGMSGSDRLVKVVPVIKDEELPKSLKQDKRYPPGSGIPQWKLTKPVNFRLEAIVLEYPSGRFIPKEGYTQVKYK